MSASIEYENNGLGVLVRYLGSVASDELVEVNKSIHGVEQHPCVQYQIYDLSAVDSLEFSAEKFRAVTRLDKAALNSEAEMKIAFIADHEVVKSIVHMWCAFIDPSEQRVQQFSSLDLARAWISEPLPLQQAQNL